MNRPIVLFAVLFLGLGVSAQEASHFQLTLPDFFDTPFDGAAPVVDLPDRPIQTMKILIKDAMKLNIPSSAVQVWINGKGVTNILDSVAVPEGLIMSMDAASLRLRRDEVFDRRENTIEVVAQDRRPRRYYQSWVLRTGGRQNDYFAYSGVVSPDDPHGVPPDVILETPSAPPVLQPGESGLRLALRGTCSAAHPPIVLKVNGQPLPPLVKVSQTFEATVNVTRATGQVVLEAVDQRDNRRMVVIPVAVRDKAAPKPMAAGKKFALLVGVSHFGAAADAPPDLPYAAPDATQLAKELHEKDGFPNENIRLLVNDKAGPLELRTALYDFAAKAEKDDLLVVYIAGRAVHDPHPGKNEKLYLAPYGAQVSQMEGTGISFDDLEMWLSRAIRSNHTFLIFDVSHPVEGQWRYPGVSVVNAHLLNFLPDQAGRAILVSGSSGEVSLSSANGELSFTHWLAHGLSGEADLNQDGVVTADELFHFVSEKVREESSGGQNPRYRFAGTNADVLAAISPGK